MENKDNKQYGFIIGRANSLGMEEIGFVKFNGELPEEIVNRFNSITESTHMVSSTRFTIEHPITVMLTYQLSRIFLDYVFEYMDNLAYRKINSVLHDIYDITVRYQSVFGEDIYIAFISGNQLRVQLYCR